MFIMEIEQGIRGREREGSKKREKRGEQLHSNMEEQSPRKSSEA